MPWTVSMQAAPATCARSAAGGEVNSSCESGPGEQFSKRKTASPSLACCIGESLPVATVLRSTFPLPHPPDAKFRRRFARRGGSAKQRGVAALPEPRADPTVRNDRYGVAALDHAVENRASKGSGGRRSRGGVSTAMMRTAGSVTCCLTMGRWMSRLFRWAIRFRRRSAWLRRCENWRKRGI